MAVIDTLMKTAVADTDLLRSLDAQGDQFRISRDVEFLLRAPSVEKATTVANFINDHQYGIATVQELDGSPSILIVVHMPIEQHAIQSVSGFMVCLCELFDLEYDGWGCVAQAHA